MSLNSWLEKRYRAKIDQHYKNGYDWAAGALLRKDKTPMEIESMIDGPEMDIPRNAFGDAFDNGASDAITDITCDLVVVKDDRI